MEENVLSADALDPQFEDDPGGQQEPPAEPSNPTPPAGPDDSDEGLIQSILSQNGIKDVNKIKFEGENDTVVEKSWKELTREEKLNILRTPQSSAEDFSEDELNLIQKIRDSKQTPSDYLASLERAATKAVETQTYDIDGLSDDELFVLDAIDRFGNENITDEQLETLLNNAKSDPDLYAKNIASLRAQYKQKEDDLRLQQQQQDDAQQEQEYKNFSESILNEIKSLNQVAGQSIELSVDDMNELANFILTRDDNGDSEFGKVMNDPKMFTQVAFWALKGNDIMSEISSQIRLAYEKGLAEGKKGQPKLAITQKQDPKTRTQHLAFKSDADSLDVD